jgi:hypothetical protein
MRRARLTILGFTAAAAMILGSSPGASARPRTRPMRMEPLPCGTERPMKQLESPIESTDPARLAMVEPHAHGPTIIHPSHRDPLTTKARR